MRAETRDSGRRRGRDREWVERERKGRDRLRGDIEDERRDGETVRVGRRREGEKRE